MGEPVAAGLPPPSAGPAVHETTRATAASAMRLARTGLLIRLSAFHDLRATPVGDLVGTPDISAFDRWWAGTGPDLE